MTVSHWTVVQREGADRDDRQRAEQLSTLLGAALVRTGEPDELDAVLTGLDAGSGVAICGGDGSLHHAANALDRVGRLEDVAVGLLPAGTGNDYAGFLALPEEPEKVAELLRRGEVAPVDLIRITAGTEDLGVAVNAVHTGIGVEAAEKAQDWKASLGDFAYPVGSLQAGLSGDGWDLRVRADDAVIGQDAPVLMAAVTSGGTIGGGRRISPSAKPDDGLLDVMVSHAVAPTDRAGFAVGLARGTHVDRDDVHTRQARRVSFSGRLRLNVDGELWDDAVSDPSFEVLAGALGFVRTPVSVS